MLQWLKKEKDLYFLLLTFKSIIQCSVYIKRSVSWKTNKGIHKEPFLSHIYLIGIISKSKTSNVGMLEDWELFQVFKLSGSLF